MRRSVNLKHVPVRKEQDVLGRGCCIRDRCSASGLFPRLPGAESQLLAVVGFDDTTTVWRIGWRDGTVTEAGRLPAPVNGGVWLDETGDRLAVNLEGESGRSSVYVVDFGAALGGSRRPCRGDTPRPPGSSRARRP